MQRHELALVDSALPVTTLRDRIQSDLHAAMLAKDEPRKAALRMLTAAIKNADIEAGSELTEGDLLVVVQRQVKQRRESIEEFRKGGRDDLAEREEAELEAFAGYLPKEADRGEISEAAHLTIKETGASGPRDIGKVMPLLIKQFQGRADGRVISEIVRELLG